MAEGILFILIRSQIATNVNPFLTIVALGFAVVPHSHCSQISSVSFIMGNSLGLVGDVVGISVGLGHSGPVLFSEASLILVLRQAILGFMLVL